MYKNLTKNIRYSFKYGKKVRSGKYLKRYFNKEMSQWFYVFELFYGCYLTVETKKCKILLENC